MADTNARLRSFLVAALLLAPAAAGAERQARDFYLLRVVTAAGAVISGHGGGLSGGYGPTRPPLHLVEVEPRRRGTWLTHHFVDGREPQIHVVPPPTDTSFVVLFEEYQRFEMPPDRVFFLFQRERRIPLNQVRRIEYVEVIGRGFRIAQDPSIFRDVPEPFLALNECHSSCAKKLRSHDPTVSRETLERLWSEHFSCEVRGRFRPHSRLAPDDWGDPEKFALFHRYRLELVRDPTCIY